jgi:aromatic-L-amino-acid decarboxylase
LSSLRKNSADWQPELRHLVAEDASEDERNRFNLALLKWIIARGRVYLSNATLHGKFCLRVCIVNHLTKEADIDEVIPEVLAAASTVSGSESR